jgi:hypothetical protein
MNLQPNENVEIIFDATIAQPDPKNNRFTTLRHSFSFAHTHIDQGFESAFRYILNVPRGRYQMNFLLTASNEDVKFQMTSNEFVIGKFG